MEDPNIRKRFHYLFPILLLLVVSRFFYIPFHASSFFNTKNSSELQEPTVLNVVLIENKSIGWFQACIGLQVTTDVPINMSYSFSGIGDDSATIPSTNSSVFRVESGTSEIEICIRPVWTTFPSSFRYYLSLSYINSTSQIAQIQYEITEGYIQIIMGMPLALILAGVLLIGIVSIIARPVRLRKPKGDNPSEADFNFTETSVVNNSISDGESGEIQCPECKEKIAEGSAFCPECGFHIPKFLRTRE